MSDLQPVVITGAVEGDLDEVVLRRLIRHVGALPGPVHGKQGKQYLGQKVKGYNYAARLMPWVVLMDLDHSAECPPPLRALWLPKPSPYMSFRIAVRSVESWLMGDQERFARFFGIPFKRVPRNPDEVDEPKRKVVDLSSYSRRREIRQDIVPRSGSGRMVGPAYTSHLIEYVLNTGTGWRPETAANHSESLRRCLRDLRELIKRVQRGIS